jgi:hypothetical protein
MQYFLRIYIKGYMVIGANGDDFEFTAPQNDKVIIKLIITYKNRCLHNS